MTRHVPVVAMTLELLVAVGCPPMGGLITWQVTVLWQLLDPRRSCVAAAYVQRWGR